eukprot:scaffold66983_cov62-Phaeocystis_antarctica.AAC.2
MHRAAPERPSAHQTWRQSPRARPPLPTPLGPQLLQGVPLWPQCAVPALPPWTCLPPGPPPQQQQPAPPHAP